MPEAELAPMPERSTERHPGLEPVAVYTREVEAPIDAVWENVFDWEHLPWLHSQAFTSIEAREAGDWGWHADVGLLGGALAEIELVVDHERSCYVARTRSGAGAPGEIWTSLDPTTSARTSVRVEFCMPPMASEAQEQIGSVYRDLYTGLWDQDEEMMQARISSGAEREGGGDHSPADVDLGDWATLRQQLPRVVSFGGHRFRIVDVEGTPRVHAVECPHWRGPLDACAVTDGVVTCPWHGYRFDVASGKSADDRGLRLRPAPRLEIDPTTATAKLVAPS